MVGQFLLGVSLSALLALIYKNPALAVNGVIVTTLIVVGVEVVKDFLRD